MTVCTEWPPAPLEDVDSKVWEYLKRVRAAAAIIFDHQTGKARFVSILAVDLDPEAPDENT